jgi:hypothetical protein
VLPEGDECNSPPRAAGIQMRKTRGPNMGTMARVTISAKDEQDAVCQLSQHTKHQNTHTFVVNQRNVSGVCAVV